MPRAAITLHSRRETLTACIVECDLLIIQREPNECVIYGVQIRKERYGRSNKPYSNLLNLKRVFASRRECGS